jgi:hypothetical protein
LWKTDEKHRSEAEFMKIVAGLLAVVAATALFITNVETIVGAYYKITGKAEEPVDSQDLERIVGPIRVVGITNKNKKHSDGRYFDFYASELDALLHRSDWDNQMFFISPRKDAARYKRAVLWRRKAGGAGTATGRYLPDGQSGDWKGGESIYLDSNPQGTWIGKKTKKNKT